MKNEKKTVSTYLLTRMAVFKVFVEFTNKIGVFENCVSQASFRNTVLIEFAFETTQREQSSCAIRCVVTSMINRTNLTR